MVLVCGSFVHWFRGQYIALRINVGVRQAVKETTGETKLNQYATHYSQRSCAWQFSQKAEGFWFNIFHFDERDA